MAKTFERMMTIRDFLALPEDTTAYDSATCPNQRKCQLIGDGKGRFACRICGVGFWGKLEPFDWHGDYPWVSS